MKNLKTRAEIVFHCMQPHDERTWERGCQSPLSFAAIKSAAVLTGYLVLKRAINRQEKRREGETKKKTEVERKVLTSYSATKSGLQTLVLHYCISTDIQRNDNLKNKIDPTTKPYFSHISGRTEGGHLTECPLEPFLCLWESDNRGTRRDRASSLESVRCGQTGRFFWDYICCEAGGEKSLGHGLQV